MRKSLTALSLAILFLLTACGSVSRGEVAVAGCVALMDEYRIAAAGESGTEGF